MQPPWISACLPFREQISAQPKGVVKLHVGLNHAGYLPEFVTITEGKTHDVVVGRTLEFTQGSMVVIDKAYTDYAWYKQLTEKGIYFVARLKSNTRYRIVERRDVLSNVITDQDGLVKLAEMQDMKPAYDSATLIVNPVLFGTGLKVKSIEALGYSKPLDTTSVGAEGLEYGVDSAFYMKDSRLICFTQSLKCLCNWRPREN